MTRSVHSNLPALSINFAVVLFAFDPENVRTKNHARTENLAQGLPNCLSTASRPNANCFWSSRSSNGVVAMNFSGKFETVMLDHSHRLDAEFIREPEDNRSSQDAE